MLDYMSVTVDILKYETPEEYEGWMYCYVHEFDRIICSTFSTAGCPTNLYFLHMGYKKNIKLLLSLDDTTNDIIMLKDEAKDCIITNLHGYDIQLIGAFRGYEQQNEEKIAKVSVNDFIFKISCSLNKTQNNLSLGQKIYFKSLIRLKAFDEFNNMINKIYCEIKPSRDDHEGWPNNKTYWPDPNFKVGKGESPLEKLVLNDPEYVRKKLNRENFKDYPIILDRLNHEKWLKIDEDDKINIEHLIVG